MRRLGALLVAGILLIACTKAESPRAEPSATPAALTASGVLVPSISASASASPPRPSWAQSWPTTWTDPRVVDALAEKCDFVPDESAPGSEMQHPGDMFRCLFAYEQSCNPDYCYSGEETCKTACTKTCLDCGAACSKSCESCKADCKDASCKHHCAETCASCKQTCENASDHCGTAECGKKHADCQKRMKESWQSGNCLAKCKRWKTCQNDCAKANTGPECPARCETALSPTWRPCMDTCTREHPDQYTRCTLDCTAKAQCAPELCMDLPP